MAGKWWDAKSLCLGGGRAGQPLAQGVGPRGHMAPFAAVQVVTRDKDSTELERLVVRACASMAWDIFSL